MKNTNRKIHVVKLKTENNIVRRIQLRKKTSRTNTAQRIQIEKYNPGDSNVENKDPKVQFGKIQIIDRRTIVRIGTYNPENTNQKNKSGNCK